MPAPDFDTLAQRLAHDTRRSIGLLGAGFVYWCAMAVAASLLTERQAATMMLLGTAAIFPLGLAFTRLAGGTLFTRANPLGDLTALTLAAYAMYWPVFLLVFARAPSHLPHVLALLMAAPFFVVAYVYRSPAYRVVAMVRLAAVGGLMLVPGSGYTLVPAVTAATYALGVVLVLIELRQPALCEVPA